MAIVQNRTGGRGSVWAAAALLAFAILCAYANSFNGAFVLDDLGAVVHNESIRSLSPEKVLGAPPAGTTVSGRPLLNLSFALNYAVSGTDVWSYHALNLLIHILAALALFGIVRRTLLRWGALSPARTGGRALHLKEGDFGAVGATLPALAVALLWALHPLQTQAVTYIVQRAESLMGMFYLLTLYCFIRHVERGQTAAGAGAWAALAALACLLGAATKEVMATAPAMVLLYDRCFVSGTFGAALRARWRIYLSLASSWILLAFLVAGTGGNRSGTSGFNVGVSAWAYWLTQFEAVAHYLRLVFWPAPLVFEYGTFWVSGAGGVLPYAIPVLAIAGATAWALFSPAPEGSARRRFGFLGAWFFGILSVTSLIPGIYQMIVEHRMYLPLAAVVSAAVVGLWRWLGRTGLWVSLALAACCLPATLARNRDYRSALDLWRDTVAKRPGNETAQVSLAVALFQSGRAADSIPHYEAALTLNPDATDTLNDLGCALLSVGRAEEGIVRLGRAVQLKPDVAEYHFNLANALAGHGHMDEAIGHFRDAIRLDPGYAEAHLRLAVALWLAGQRDEAVAERAEGMRLEGTAP